ncbi:hypothetical protein CN645_21915 [Burkholderia sp. IDO3]|nr:hypothetical protein DCN14_35645 [Burkholderia sp. IDO3]PCD59786.1 hypothetical protein CN645_21915 [Burkholderia sp. IDO3]
MAKREPLFHDHFLVGVSLFPPTIKLPSQCRESPGRGEEGHRRATDNYSTIEAKPCQDSDQGDDHQQTGNDQVHVEWVRGFGVWGCATRGTAAGQMR